MSSPFISAWHGGGGGLSYCAMSHMEPGERGGLQGAALRGMREENEKLKRVNSYFVNYRLVGEVAARKHELGEIACFQAMRVAHDYENRGCCVELWEQKDGAKPVRIYETEDEN